MHIPAFFNADFFHAMFLIFSLSELTFEVKSFELTMEVKYIFSIWNITFTLKVRPFLSLTPSSFFFSTTVLILVKNPRIFKDNTCSEDETVCPQGWNQINNNCFFQSEHGKAWRDGQANCIAYRGSLAIFNSKNEVARFLLCNINRI